MKILKVFSIIALMAIIVSCSDNSTNPVDPGTKSLGNYPQLEALYDKDPDPAQCYEGVLKNSEKQKVLNRVNYFRRMHGLSDVSYNSSADIYVQKASLLSYANKTLNHYPTPAAKCYSVEADSACGSSNLHLGYSTAVSNWKSEDAVDGWLNEKNSIGGAIGHRRWLLNPLLKTVSFGRVDAVETNNYHYTASTLHIFDFGPQPASKVEYVAFPYGNYPNSAFEPASCYLSFSVFADKTTIWGLNSKVDFKNVTIQVKDPSGSNVAVTDITYDNQGAGLTNNLEWKASTMITNVKYTVSISNVSVNGTAKNYSYDFTVVQ